MLGTLPGGAVPRLSARGEAGHGRCSVAGESMKLPHLHLPHLPKLNVRSLAFQTTLELVLGGLAIALLLRWIAW
jgi:hypothetical protein